MCGIAGILLGSRVWQHVEGLKPIEAMTASLYRRGPDDSGIWISVRDGVALGHRRLSIIDLTAAGRQPMTSQSGRYVLVFNGEIYNYQSLRAALASAGVLWRGTSDSEVLLESIDHWGIESTLRRIEGMFAFGVWDARERTLTLARDRLGEKPLYLAKCVDQSFIFGSELKALMEVPSFRRSIDRTALTLFVRHGYIPAPNCIFENSLKIPAGCKVVIRPNDVVLPSPSLYWSAATTFASGAQNPYNGSYIDAIDELDQRISSSVASRMHADVPVGAFLSGGVDSSLVTAKMQLHSMNKVKTFTIGFREQGFDESKFARAVAAHLGTDHTEIQFDPTECLRLVDQLPSAYDEPFSDSSQLPSLLLADVTRTDVAVALTGDGGDELFSGYRHHALLSSLWRAVGLIPAGLRARLFSGLCRLSDPSVSLMLRSLRPILPQELRGQNGVYRFRRLMELAVQPTRSLAHRQLVSDCRDPDRFVTCGTDPGDQFSADWRKFDEIDTARFLSFLDLIQYLPEDLLVKVDRASMFHSLECRIPLLDTGIVEFALRLPLHFKLQKGKGKLILKDVLYRMIPKELCDRPKSGFQVPIAEWLRGPLKEWAGDLLNESRIRREGFLDFDAVKQTWAEHQGQAFNREHLLWSLLMFQSWTQKYDRT